MNNKVATIAFDFLITFEDSNPKPVMNERYPGTKGNTHGDRKEIIPALKEIRIAISKEPWVTVFILQPSLR
jgi:hypothetical protein